MEAIKALKPKLVERPIAMLTPYAKNARVHSPEQVDQIVASIKAFGFTNPVLINPQNGIIAGHGRVMAATKLGLDKVPCIVLSGLTPEQERAYIIADNKLALNASWDIELLAFEIADLQSVSFDTSLLGFDATELTKLLASTKGLTDPDSVPDVEERAVTQPGDTWILGRHRVHCGDSTSAASVAAALGGTKPLLMVTDPPYGVNYDPAWREKTDRVVRSTGKVLNDDRADWREAWQLFPGDVAYVWHGALHAGTVAESLHVCGFELRAQIVWAKQHFTFGRGDYHWKHETCWYAVRKGASGHWSGDRKQTTVWEIANNNPFGNPAREQVWGHGTQKPVECMRRPIVNNSEPGDAVYDPFLGSGTTLIAAEMTARKCVGLELSPQYVDVIVKRWQAFTGLEAILDATGETFAKRA